MHDRLDVKLLQSQIEMRHDQPPVRGRKRGAVTFQRGVATASYTHDHQSHITPLPDLMGYRSAFSPISKREATGHSLLTLAPRDIVSYGFKLISIGAYILDLIRTQRSILTLSTR